MNTETLNESINYKLADKSVRLGNYIIDTIAFCFILFVHALILDGLFGMVPEEGSPFLGIYFLVLYVGYYTIFEYLFGKSPGKFITKTHVLNSGGFRPTFLNILGRNLCRLIPFDNISLLFSISVMHDKFSKTLVVDDSR